MAAVRRAERVVLCFCDGHACWRLCFSYTYTCKARNLKRPHGLTDPIITSSLVKALVRFPPSVVDVGGEHDLCPVFVEPGFEGIDAGGSYHRWRHRILLVDDAHAEGVPSDAGDGSGLEELPLVSMGVAHCCRGE